MKEIVECMATIFIRTFGTQLLVVGEGSQITEAISMQLPQRLSSMDDLTPQATTTAACF